MRKESDSSKVEERCVADVDFRKIIAPKVDSTLLGMLARAEDLGVCQVKDCIDLQPLGQAAIVGRQGTFDVRQNGKQLLPATRGTAK